MKHTLHCGLLHAARSLLAATGRTLLLREGV